MTTSRAREAFHMKNTLAVLLVAMVDRKVLVEMKNDSTIVGTVIEADGFGNLTLSDAQIISIKGFKVKAELTHVKSSAMRYVRLPNDVNPSYEIKQQFSKLAQQKKERKVMPFKVK